jgi:protein-disulfide isomerase
MMDAIDQRRVALRRGILGTLPLILAMCLPACSAAAGDNVAKDDPNQVLAKVNGQAITAADVRANAKETFDQLDREYLQQKHDLIEAQLKAVIQDRLAVAEAAAQKITKEQLLASIKATEVTDADVDKFYEENKSRIRGTKEQVAPQIKQYLGADRQMQAREKYFASLEDKYKTETLFEPIRAKVVSAGFPAKGPAEAPVTIVEFSDFQCPFCSRLNPTLEQVMSTYGTRVRLVFRQFPLPIHQNASKAAEAALCANEQGKFWQMHDAMFKDQGGLAVEGLKAKAAGIGLDANSFAACLDNGKEADAVKADLKAGQDLGVNGTPAIFVNGRFLNGAVPYEKVAQLIDDELKRSAQHHGGK